MSNEITPEDKTQNVGCLLLIVAALIVVVGGGAVWAWNEMSGNTTGDKIEATWQRMTAVQRQAFCAPVTADPSFKGTASGLAEMVNDPDVGVTQTHGFLLEVCP